MAIQANELRIGNLVYTGFIKVTGVEKPCIVTCVKMDEVGKGTVILDKGFTFGIDGIESIPLTPEILLKAGFIKDEEGYKITGGGRVTILLEQKEYSDGSIYFDVSIELNVGMGFNLLCVNPPDHLHQLQNLFFIHTGTELEMKDL